MKTYRKEDLEDNLKREDFLFFWGHTSKSLKPTKSCLSQWWKCYFIIDGNRYNCAEQFMMAEKARLFNDIETLDKIMQSSEPLEQKSLGRKIKGFDDDLWRNKSFDIVFRGNLAKFIQNRDLKNFLLSTDEKILVEASPLDSVWGIGLDANSPCATNPHLWNGENLLGFVLMKVRDYLKSYSNVDSLLIKDKIKGCLMAGAAGDALGYEVEFMTLSSIRSKFGNQGITKFALDFNGPAIVSDDTQMTLFTANGLLMGLTRGYMRGVGGNPETYVDFAYIDWYYTQTGIKRERPYTWLRDLPQMFYRRAPGNTCLLSCKSILQGENVINNSKGCGGIMRVAPMALLASVYASRDKILYSLEELAIAGAEIARFSHKHPLGFLPAALLTILLYRVIPLSTDEIKDQIDIIIIDSISILNNIFKGEFEKEKQYLKTLTEKSVRLARSNMSDSDAISQLGEGWVAEETWAIALYSAIRHIDNVEDAIIASVNHDGDSDSTGSVCGNIMGAIYGYEHIRERNIFCPDGKQLEDTIELSEIILALADDLSTGCIISEYNPVDTPEKVQWYERYCQMRPSGINL